MSTPTCLFRGPSASSAQAITALGLGMDPSLRGVKEKLENGARVADVGCGPGASTILMALAYPKSKFYGTLSRAVDPTRQAAGERGRRHGDHVRKGQRKGLRGRFDYDMIAFFDCLHDMGDPLGAGKHVHETLAPDGTWMIVEPFAHDDLKDNLNPVGRVYYAASTMICTPASLSQEVGMGLGAQAGEARLKKVAKDAGFSKFRTAAETPFNLVFEARV